MKKYLLALFALFAVASAAHAQSYNFTDNTRIRVPEYNNYNGWEVGGTARDVVGSSIDVSGVTGKISDLNVTLNNVTSKAFIDMVFVLVGPMNKAVVLASNAGGANENGYVPTVDITFDDEANSKIDLSESFHESQTVNKNIAEGSYQLSAYDLQPFYNHKGYFSVLDPVAEGFFGDPGMFAGNTTLSAFDDLSANGTWQLLAFDNYSTDATSFGGWTLSFETTPSSADSGAVPEPAEWALLILASLGVALMAFYRKTGFSF